MVNVTGTAGNDTLNGTNGAFDSIVAGAGRDLVTGRFGPDALNGDAGRDTLYGGGQDDTLLGDADADSLSGGSGDDDLYGGAGADTLFGDSGNDSFLDGATSLLLTGGDVLFGGLGNDSMTLDYGRRSAGVTVAIGDWIGAQMVSGNLRFSQIENLVIVATRFADDVTGGIGADSMSGGAGDDTLRGGEGGDSLGGDTGNDLLSGGSGDDLLFGGEGRNRLFGGSGRDTLEARGDGDYLSGDGGADVLYADQGAATLNGGGGDDLLVSGTGAHRLLAGAGDDRLIAYGGRDIVSGDDGDDLVESFGSRNTLYGGLGIDTLRLGETLAQNFVALDPDTLFRLADGTQFVQFEAYIIDFDGIGRRVVTRDGEDVLRLGFGNDTVSAGGGDDLVSAGDGDDSVAGGAGDDSLDGGGGLADTLDGGAGEDALRVDRTAYSRDFVFSVSGTTATISAGTVLRNGEVFYVSFGRGDDVVTGVGDALNVIFDGGAGNDTLRGGTGRDNLNGGTGADILIGGAGDDYIAGAQGNDRLFGGAGNDTFAFALDADYIDAGSGNDTATVFENVFTGTAVSQILLGTGDDVLTIVGRSDGLIDAQGGAGTDTVTLRLDAAGAVRFALSDDMTLLAGSLRLRAFEVVNLTTGTGRDSLTGGALADTIVSGAGDDVLFGGAGNDSLDGQTGADRVFGGLGDDALGRFGFQDDGLASQLYGGAGNDFIHAHNRDRIVGGDGIDLMYLSLFGSNAAFTLDLSLAGVQSGSGLTVISGIEQADVFGGAGRMDVTGGALNDALGGSSRNDILRGMGGDDNFYDDGGDDRFYGGSGADTFRRFLPDAQQDVYDGGIGRDTVAFDTFAPISGTFVVVDLGNQALNAGMARGLRLISIENVTGSYADDAIRGTMTSEAFRGVDGDDVLRGLGGNDTLEGGAGGDLLFGGDGADQFVFRADWRGTAQSFPTPGLVLEPVADEIGDFVGGRDRLVLEGAAFDLALTDTVRLVTGAAPAATGLRGQFQFETDNGRLWYDADGAGNAERVLLVTLTGVSGLSADDFLVI